MPATAQLPLCPPAQPADDDRFFHLTSPLTFPLLLPSPVSGSAGPSCDAPVPIALFLLAPTVPAKNATDPPPLPDHRTSN
ncbi:hypothetical protein Neut_1476 [Nitrosomonas eutropha C91]|uniref:Uncharacterized protein n=1 Tax=Nitrosomonas eutropha (strain DSM 101675 / C91 / Nm57) TaxID=335283 RepID=Q0AG10_NITEC|nr:hypothetical protein Neut_1476 [Nitrosomonas eutropha C91]